MRSDPAAPVAVLSPHLDDAVVSVWHVLTGDGRAQVVNVFAGLPPADPGPTMADRLAGFDSSAELLKTRYEEDREALALVGCEPVMLDFIEDQYRAEPVTVDDLLDGLSALVPAAASVVAPAAIGGHPDHRLVRDVALQLASEGHPVELYGDIPYIVRYGWPSWVTGVDPGPHLVVEAYWNEFLAEITERGHRLTPHVHDLGPEGADAKLDAMTRYATQFQQLNSGIVDRLRNPLIRRYEMSWKVG
jgi:LmbE family N-acetylglucosaminyl deacetylase